ncbi:hypothetical protein NLU13_3114 [Sarocladium strictum]|uniref:Uncharacterized protein n=1 Tax=Sarocladium strictum TaxID=5046 RepID=A0AA39LA48_SARSR|nr:hypothetical protein NLU13_3114 [Sarocladium strictum]
MPRNRLQKKDFSIHQDSTGFYEATDFAKYSPLDASSARTLTPATTGSVNSMKQGSGVAAKHAISRTATIRSVPSFEGSESSPDSKHSQALSSSVNSTASGMSALGSQQYERTPQTTRMKSDSPSDTPTRWHVNGLRTLDPAASPQNDSSMLSESNEAPDGQWDSTIGKAGLGKTGRVINKLVSDNDALKREIKIEQLKAEEAKQAARLIEDKMERMVNDYESRLLEANVTKTLLARKERQVETLTATVEAEKKRTAEALQREKNWRDELDKVRKDTEIQIDEATGYAQLMEGRYNAISSHWRDQGDQVKRAVSGMKNEIETLNEERRSDDDKIQTLRDLCEQQDSNIQQLRREKEDIARKFEEYKQAQEDGLRDIKINAARREAEQERILEESREALAKLKWALNVKQNVKGAQ